MSLIIVTHDLGGDRGGHRSGRDRVRRHDGRVGSHRRRARPPGASLHPRTARRPPQRPQAERAAGRHRRRSRRRPRTGRWAAASHPGAPTSRNAAWRHGRRSRSPAPGKRWRACATRSWPVSDPILTATRHHRAVSAGVAQTAVADADLVVEEGAAIGLVGESGSGKTTLGRVLVGALEPTAGAVEIGGRSWSSVKRNDPLRSAAQMIFQDPYGSLNPMLRPTRRSRRCSGCGARWARGRPARHRGAAGGRAERAGDRSPAQAS